VPLGNACCEIQATTKETPLSSHDGVKKGIVSGGSEVEQKLAGWLPPCVTCSKPTGRCVDTISMAGKVAENLNAEELGEGLSKSSRCGGGVLFISQNKTALPYINNSLE
jgi:hypothetical protein